MIIVINGTTIEISQPITVVDLIKKYRINGNNCIVELNGKFVNLEQYDQQVQEGDSIELIRFIGGG